jgi:ferredoxin
MCPGVFRFDTTGKVMVTIEELPEALEHECRQTALVCPGEAIEIVNVA